jgi:hydroxymethylbilane synthase
MNCSSRDSEPIIIAARASALSRAQVEEVLRELNCSAYAFSFKWVATRGDKDLKTSLRGLEKSDFFTYEIDQMLLKRECRIAVHSAKDLPEPLCEGLAVAALTRGVDPADVLVFRDGESVKSLPLGAKIGTSSLRREKMLRSLRADFISVDIRGTIEQRLSLLDRGDVDGLIMAEAALIRLKLAHRTRIPLAHDSAPLQGRLAIVACAEDREMHELFACLNAP